MYREIVERLLAYPQRGQIQIDFDLKKKVFKLSVPIFSSKEEINREVIQYVDARKNLNFKPHVTSYSLDAGKVLLIQEIPFTLDIQSTFRKEVEQFWQMSRQCHKMLSEIAVEDIYKDALRLPS